MQWIRSLAAALAACASLGASAGQYTDIWYDPQKPGSGVSVVQQLETAFVTLYVYGPDGRPTWYVASDAQVTGYTVPGSFPLFRGTLYRTEGTPQGLPYDPSRSRTVPVGELYLEVITKTQMRVHYTVDGVGFVNTVTRHSFSGPAPATHYLGQFILRLSVPNGPPIGTAIYPAEMFLHFGEDGQGFMRVDDHLGNRCEYRGPYGQGGKLVAFVGNFTCTGGDALAGSFEILDLEANDISVSATLRKFAPNVTEVGRFAAVRQ